MPPGAMPESSIGKAAQCEDWDSDANSPISGTAVQAQREKRSQQQQQQQQQRPARSSSRQPKLAERPRQRDTASDSGYSSVNSAPLVAKPPVLTPVQPVARPAASPSRTKPNPKPVIHRADSARSTQRAQTVSVPPTRQTAQCPDPHCRDPDCLAGSNTERRYTLPRQPPSQHQSQPQPHYPNAAPLQQYPHYPYLQRSQTPSAAMMMPPPPPPPQVAAAVPRPPPSRPRPARPVTIHGMPSSGQPGPPPAASAYYGYPQSYAQQSHAYFGSTPPTQVAAYPPTSPVLPSPTSSSITYPGFPGYTATYSARQANPAVPGLGMPKSASQPGLTRTLSARRPAERSTGRMPGTFPDPESTGSETDSLSDSNSEFSSDDEYGRRRDSRRYSRAKESTVAMVPHPRRPSMSKKYHTEMAVPTSHRQSSRPRESLRRAPQSDIYFDHPSSSDRGDSDRTARAVIDRRSGYSSTRSSRRPSIATTASSGRTKATTTSSMTDYSDGRMVVEAKNGRRTSYLSREQADLMRRQERQELDAQRISEEKIAAYQKTMSGGDPYELTAENMRMASNRKSGSHASGRSQKSSGSSSKMSRAGGFQIKTGDTVLEFFGDAKIEMRQDEDGGPAKLVIATGNGRHAEYRTSSKSSGSRSARSRARGETTRRGRDAIHEEDDY